MNCALFYRVFIILLISYISAGETGSVSPEKQRKRVHLVVESAMMHQICRVWFKGESSRSHTSWRNHRNPPCKLVTAEWTSKAFSASLTTFVLCLHQYLLLLVPHLRTRAHFCAWMSVRNSLSSACYPLRHEAGQKAATFVRYCWVKMAAIPLLDDNTDVICWICMSLTCVSENHACDSDFCRSLGDLCKQCKLH